MTVGMLLIRGQRRQLKADQGHHRIGAVHQVVHRVGGDGQGAGKGAYRKLQREQQYVAHDAHQSGQQAIGPPDFGIIGPFPVFYKNSQ